MKEKKKPSHEAKREGRGKKRPTKTQNESENRIECIESHYGFHVVYYADTFALQSNDKRQHRLFSYNFFFLVE